MFEYSYICDRQKPASNISHAEPFKLQDIELCINVAGVQSVQGEE